MGQLPPEPPGESVLWPLPSSRPGPLLPPVRTPVASGPRPPPGEPPPQVLSHICRSALLSHMQGLGRGISGTCQSACCPTPGCEGLWSAEEGRPSGEGGGVAAVPGQRPMRGQGTCLPGLRRVGARARVTRAQVTQACVPGGGEVDGATRSQARVWAPLTPPATPGLGAGCAPVPGGGLCAPPEPGDSAPHPPTHAQLSHPPVRTRTGPPHGAAGAQRCDVAS